MNFAFCTLLFLWQVSYELSNLATHMSIERYVVWAVCVVEGGELIDVVENKC